MRALNPQIKIILINLYADDALFQEDAFIAGASACLAPSVPVQELLATLEQVLHSAKLFEPKILNGVFQGEPLTRREIEILKQLAKGKSDKQIADALCISVNTARNHAQNVLRKLQAKDRDAAVWRAKIRGWI